MIIRREPHGQLAVVEAEALLTHVRRKEHSVPSNGTAMRLGLTRRVDGVGGGELADLPSVGGEQAKGRLHDKTAHRYLVKLIQNCQEELDLHAQEAWLLEFAKVERGAWLQELEQDYDLLKTECSQTADLDHDLAFHLSEKAVFGGLPLVRAFWEAKLHDLLAQQWQRFEAVRRHIKRLYEAPANDRFHLISLLAGWEQKLAQ